MNAQDLRALRHAENEVVQHRVRPPATVVVFDRHAVIVRRRNRCLNEAHRVNGDAIGGERLTIVGV